VTPPVLGQTRGENGTGRSTTNNDNVTQMNAHVFPLQEVGARKWELSVAEMAAVRVQAARHVLTFRWFLTIKEMDSQPDCDAALLTCQRVRYQCEEKAVYRLAPERRGHLSGGAHPD
jgi:hypothetical protein